MFDFVMKVEGLTFPEAARRLAEHAGIEVEETATDAERRKPMRPNAPLTTSTRSTNSPPIGSSAS